MSVNENTVTENTVTKNTAAPHIELNGPAPDFEAQTTQGNIRFYDWQKDRWVVLFSHPADFTPVCSTEFAEFARRTPELERRNVALLGVSVDSVYSHIAWTRSIEQIFGQQVRFPVIADLDQKVARLYGMIHTPTADTQAVRCVFIIDPKHSVRAMVYYPMQVGRNIDEILRLVDGLQTADQYSVATPANWHPGDDVIVPAPKTSSAANERVDQKDVQVKDWYLATQKLKLKPQPAAH